MGTLKGKRRASARQAGAVFTALLLVWSIAIPPIASANENNEIENEASSCSSTASTGRPENGDRNPGEEKILEAEGNEASSPENGTSSSRTSAESVPERDQSTTAAEKHDEQLPAGETPGPLVALIDTGCDESLCERAVSVIDDDPSDSCGHGTSLANAILEQDPSARILSIKTLDAQEHGSASNVCAALRLAIDSDADIISIPPPTYGLDEQASVEMLMQQALDRGTAVVAATNDWDAGTYGTFNAAFAHSTLQCKLHVSNIGDSQWMPINESAPIRTKDSSMTSATFGNYVNGYWQHIENMAFRIIRNGGPDGGISYRVYYRNGGWDAWRSDDAYSPATTGAGNVAMALQAVLTGNMAAAYSLTYRVRISDADPITKIDGRDSPLGWTWPQASDGGTAGTTDYNYGLEDVRMWLTPKSYTHTIQVRYQNADGSYGRWTNARSGTYAFGSTVPAWSRAADGTYNAASISAYTAGFSTTVKQATITRRSYYLDVNARLDGAGSGGCGSYGTFDFVVNGSKRAEDASDYYQTALAGSTWSITNIRAKPGYTYDGAVEGSSSGTLGTSDAQAVRLAFHTNTYTVTFDENGANSGAMGEQRMRCHAKAPLTACSFEREGYSFEGWNTEPDGSGAAYGNGEAVVNLALADNANVKLYAQWKRDLRLPATGSHDLADVAATAFMLATYGSATAIASRRKRR